MRTTLNISPKRWSMYANSRYSAVQSRIASKSSGVE